MNRREMKVSNFLHMQYLTPIKKKFFFFRFSVSLSGICIFPHKAMWSYHHATIIPLAAHTHKKCGQCRSNVGAIWLSMGNIGQHCS